MPRHNHRSMSSSSNPRFRKQYRYKSRCSNSSGTTAITNRSSVTQNRKKKTSTAWENIVIHYLQKLKNYWNSTNNEKETSNREMSYQTQKRNLRESNSKERMENCCPRVSNDRVDYCLAGKRKALNIVSNALEYGLANGIVSRNGNYYWIKDRLIPKRVSNHRMNPTISPTKTVAKPQEKQPQAQPKGNSKKIPNKGRGKIKKPMIKKGRKPVKTRRGKPKKMPTRVRFGRKKGGFCNCRKCNDVFKKFSLLEDE